MLPFGGGHFVTHSLTMPQLLLILVAALVGWNMVDRQRGPQ